MKKRILALLLALTLLVFAPAFGWLIDRVLMLELPANGVKQ